MNKKNIETNLYEFYRTLGALHKKVPAIVHGAEYIDCEPFHWPRTFFGSSETEELGEIAKRIHEGILPPQWILLRPENHEEFYSKLELEGFRKMMVWPGMGLELEQADFSNHNTESVKLIEHEAELEQWFDIVNTIFFGREPMEYDFFKTCWESGLFNFYGAKVDDEIVATAMTFKSDSDIGIYMVATSDAHRRKGFARQVTLQILKDAKANDCKNAYLQATAMGAYVYEDLGFKSFCTFDIYWLLGAVQKK